MWNLSEWHDRRVVLDSVDKFSYASGVVVEAEGIVDVGEIGFRPGGLADMQGAAILLGETGRHPSLPGEDLAQPRP